MELVVKCENGLQGEVIPSAFTLGSNQFTISDVIDRWLGTQNRYFKVQTTDGSRYILRKNNELGYWELTYFCDQDEKEFPPETKKLIQPRIAA